MDNIKEKLHAAREYILGHSKLVMPILLLVCVVITVIVAVHANRREALEREAEEAARAAAEAAESVVPASTDIIETPQYELLQITVSDSDYIEIYNLVNEYYTALANGDLLTISAINPSIKDVDKIQIEEYAKYRESYPTVDIYLKPGLTDNAYVAYVCSECKFYDLETPLPGMQTYYVSRDTDGKYYMAYSTYDQTIYDYINKLSIQDDVIELSNKVNVPYNNLVETNEEVSEYMAYLKEKVKEDVGERIAGVEPSDESENSTQPEAESTPSPESEVTVVKKVKATDVVNIRKSDSEQADKIDKASVGQEFVLIEQKPNGWSEIEYKGESAFIKSDYLEASETEVVPASSLTNNDENTENTESTDNPETATEASPSPTAAPTESTTVKGKVVVTDSGVRIRKEPNTDADIIATVYTGEKLDLIESLSSGWSKVKYKNETGYIKSSFIKESN